MLAELKARVEREIGVALVTVPAWPQARPDWPGAPKILTHHILAGGITPTEARQVYGKGGWGNELIGPLLDPNNVDVLLWLSHCWHPKDAGGTQHTVSLRVQDATDFAWLNSNALGAEQYEQATATGALWL